MEATGATQEADAPLWFFILEHNNINDYSSLHCRVPWGFWSTDENPTSIPPNLIFHAPLRPQGSAFPFVWTQQLGERSFSIRARCV